MWGGDPGHLKGVKIAVSPKMSVPGERSAHLKMGEPPWNLMSPFPGLPQGVPPGGADVQLEGVRP